MFDKIKEILTSVRFWQLVIASVIFYLGSQGIITSELANTIAAFLGVSITIKTVDKFSK